MRRLVAGGAALLIVVHLALVLHGSSRHSAVFDEVIYPAAGYSYLTTGDYRLNPEHPPLLKLWTGLPWLGIGLDVTETPAWEIPDQWEVAQEMIYRSGLEAHKLLMRARSMIALLSALLAWAVFAQARKLAGSVAGFVALVLYAFDPLVVAHAGYATTDLGTAALFFLAAVSFLEALRGDSRWRAWLAGLLLGAALAAKFSALLLLGLLPAALAIELRNTRAVGEAALRSTFVLIGAAAFVCVTYGPAGPLSYLRGIGLLKLHSDLGHPTYALGQYSTEGWWWYFPVAWLIKTPIPILVAAIGGLTSLLGKRLLRDSRTALLVLAPLVVMVAAMASPLNLGVRHLLPATPFLAVVGGIAAERVWSRAGFGRGLVIAGCSWLVVGTLWVHPDELAYSNEVAGGPSRTYRLLSDSNVDWGQDLPALAEVVARQPLRRLYLGYWGTADPAAHGLRYTFIPSTRMIDRRYEPGPDPAGKEWIAISVTNLFEVASLRHDEYAWLRERPFTAFPGHSIALFDITGDPSAHVALARVAVERADFESAVPPLRRSIELRPRDGKLRAELIRALRSLGRSDEALEECDRLRGSVSDAVLRTVCPGARR